MSALTFFTVISSRKSGVAVGRLQGVVSNVSVGSNSSAGQNSGTDIGGLVGYAEQGHVASSDSAASVDGEENIGGLIGTMTWYATISNSSASGAVSGDDRIGGIVGDLADGAIGSSFATGDVTGSPISDSVGGFAGRNLGWISESYATGQVTGFQNVGGFIGLMNPGHTPTVRESYSSGDVIGAANDSIAVGGFVGSVTNGTIIDCLSISSLSVHMDTNDYGRFAGSSTGILTQAWVANDRAVSNSGTGSQNSLSTHDVTAASQFYNNQVTGPLPAWDFSSSWATVFSGLPVHQ